MPGLYPRILASAVLGVGFMVALAACVGDEPAPGPADSADAAVTPEAAAADGGGEEASPPVDDSRCASESTELACLTCCDEVHKESAPEGSGVYSTAKGRCQCEDACPVECPCGEQADEACFECVKGPDKKALCDAKAQEVCDQDPGCKAVRRCQVVNDCEGKRP
jgi:hypothetical protein